MSSFNIWVTEKCNFCCTYCYEKSRLTLSMNDETVEKTIAFIRRNINPNGYNMVNFHGGEILMLIGYCVPEKTKCITLG